ncbi:MAG: S8/S53 family peptidase [Acidobacteriaceae bacterium]|nr:S8/S53 family peptidase [Acidobacteriaceae bacterium]
MPNRKAVPLPGSERRADTRVHVKGPINADENIEIRITLKAPASLEEKAKQLASQPIDDRQYVSREDYAKQFATDDATIQEIQQFAQDHGLEVSRVLPGEHLVYLSGTAAKMNAAFQTDLQCFEQPDGTTYRGRTGVLQVPEDLVSKILSINGLDERPVARPKLRVRPTGVTPHAGQAIDYKPQQVASLYSFPTGANGQGQCVGIIELGGGFKQTDLNTYFGASHPTVTAVSVDKGKNKPTGSANGPDGEVMLDIEVVGSIATASTIAVYFAPNTNKGFLDAISAALHDTTHKPSVVSISWGSPEDGGGYTAAVLSAFNQAFQAASVLGITVLAAAGDNGSSDGMPSGNHVDFPASNPWVTACGGTSLKAANMTTIQSETVWNDGAQGGATGGGVSKSFPVPSYQTGLKATLADNTTEALTGRGVPDVAGDADPNTGYQVLVDGQTFAIGGTSAVAPLYAALVALLNQQLGKPVGFWNPQLYQAAGTTAFRDITVGNNGAYAAAKGWDACTGLGVAVGTALESALKGQTTKATSQTPKKP